MLIKFIEEKRFKNGDSRFTFEFDEEVKQIIEKKYNKKYSNDLGKLFILDAFEAILFKELQILFKKARQLNKV
jgi:hypothetical protein